MSRPASITYTLHPSSSSSTTTAAQTQALQGAIEGIRSHLPLRNLHWKSSSRTSLRTIQELEVDLVELGEVGPVRDLGNRGVLDAPLVNLCLVVCEDAEAYKTTTRNFLRDWLSLLAARRTVHAPLIILVNQGTQATDPKTGSTKSVWGKDKGILGKIKTDYNSGKRDRCVQLNLPPPGVYDPAAWPEVINKLKESLVSAFDGAILEREEAVKRGEAQRLMVGWNFCTWFLLKESLAHSFEGVNLHEDALIVYEELEAVFFQVLKEQNLSWLNRLGANSPYDDSLPILDPTAKPYRELLQHSSISIFDFRIYLFARQGVLLGRLGRITEIAKRGQWFVASLTRRLRENESDLAEHFVESWTYTATTDIVHKCDQWSQLDRPNGDYSGLIAYESARSELLDIARIQVERIGVSSGHLPDEYPFQSASSPYNPGETDDVLFESFDDGLSDDAEDAKPAGNRPSLSNKAILDAQADRETFGELYLELTKKAVLAYEACGKVNSVIRLKADLAALALYNKDWTAAYDLSRALAKSCADLHTWEPISKFALESALQSHRELGKEKDEDWVNLALAYLRVCAIVPKQKQEEEKELQSVLDGLRETEVKQDVEDHRAFKIKVLGNQATFEEEGDRSVVQVEITNALSTPIQVDSITLDLVDSQREMISFVAEEVNLEAGSNNFLAFCSTSTQGLYTLTHVTVALSGINFNYNFSDDGVTLKVVRNTEGVEVKLRMPYNIKLDDETMVVLEIKASTTPMQDVRLGLRTLTPEVGYLLESARSDGKALYADDQGYLTLPDLEARGTQIVEIPYTGVPQGETARAQIILEYETPTGSREWIDAQSIFMGLPLTVNVQDFFRPQCLLSHFTIASDGREYLRVASINLTPGSQAFEVEACRSSWGDSIVVSPRQPLSCLFKIKQTGRSDDSTALRLVIKYRRIEDEVRQIVDRAIRQVTPSNRGSITRITRQLLEDRARWLQPYIAGKSLRQIFVESSGSGIGQAGLELEKFFTAVDGASQNEDGGIWRTLEIPVDVPQQRLLTTARITPTSPTATTAQKGIYEGRALSMNLTLTTSFAWAGDRGEEDELPTLVFDILASSEDWLVVGQKKGYYTGDPSKPHTVQIVLIPMRSGHLFLPSITVNHLPTPTPAANSTSTAAPAHDNRIPSSVSVIHTERDKVEASPSPILCETYVDNAVERIHVLPAKKEMSGVIPIPLPLPVDGWEREVY